MTTPDALRAPHRARLAGILAALAAVLAPLILPPAAIAQQTHIGLRDSIPIGSNGLCEAQIQSPRAGQGLFDRSYLIVCRDADAAVGSLQVLGNGTFEAALAQATGPDAQCRATDSATLPAGLAETRALLCTRPGNPVERLVLVGRSGGRIYAASGLAVYRDALRLGLTTLATDRQVTGNVDVPLTQAGDAQAFARAQAEAISAQTALDEAYRRSNAGNFAEAAEFFAVSATSLTGTNATEAALNSALQQSNMGNFIEAGQLFAQAEARSQSDPVLARLVRNFTAIDALNQGSTEDALVALDRPLPELSDSVEATLQLQIDNAMSERLASEQGGAQVGNRLKVAERLALLDAQATYLRASALRRQGSLPQADAALRDAYGRILAVRDGRVVSMLWLRAQILGELADLAETRGDVAAAEALHGEAVAMVQRTYPASPALVTARGQLAGLYARTGRTDQAIALYRAMVGESEGSPPASTRRLFAPYFNLLSQRTNDPAAAADMFAVSQLLQRPGLAQTQAVLARELSAGSDEAAQLFRQAINLTRSIEVLRGEQAQAADRAGEGLPGAEAALAEKTAALDQLRQRQLEVQQALAAYPRYRAVSDQALTLSALQAALHPGEAYLKLVVLDDAAYAIMARPDAASVWRLSADPDRLDAMVNTLRDSIAVEEAGQTITYPFEIATARDLTKVLLGPMADSMGDVRHLVFEPDGALLRLPANLLVMDDASVARYLARIEDPAADPYDFRDTAWLGRAMEVTTAVSPGSFTGVRQARASNASGQYLGLGQNLPVIPGSAAAVQASGTRGGLAGENATERCTWSSAAWNNPISAAELRTASGVLGGGQGVEVLTGGDFTDTLLKARDDLDEFRILHFATHGLVTAPRPGCPPRPALLTSFGDGDSDGLLTFAEIFDLSLDADLVILSACNTAGTSGLAASREAGVTTGGDFALDGLVRAFVGAGGRTVVASHWPVPDDYNATGRLIAGFFEAGQGIATAEALRQAQLALMDEAETSHPFYWSAFAVVGDGAAVLRR